MEEWRPVTDWPSYEVSDQGRVRRIPDRSNKYAGRALTGTPDRKGYPICVLTNGRLHQRSAKIHILVAEAFIGPRLPGLQVNHKDGDKANNVAANLEWVTPSGNLVHAYARGLKRAPRGSAHGRAKLTDNQVRAIRALKGQFTLRQLADMFGVSRNLVWLIHANKNWTHL